MYLRRGSLEENHVLFKVPESEASLYIRKKVHGILLGTTNTNPSDYQHPLSGDECLICPVYIFSIHKHPAPPDDIIKVSHDIENYHPKHPDDMKYIIKVPHCVENYQDVQDNIGIRHYNFDHKEITNGDDTRFGINKKYVLNHTNHFSFPVIFVKSKGITQVNVYAKMEAIRQVDTKVQIEAYLESPLLKLGKSQRKVTVNV